MGNVIDDLAVYINSQSSSFTPGVKLQGGMMLDTPSTCVAILEVLGMPSPNDTFGSYNWERPQIQVISRAGRDDYLTARNNAETVYKMLRNKHSTTINGTKYHNMSPRTPPYYNGQDENFRHELTFMLDIIKDPSS